MSAVTIPTTIPTRRDITNRPLWRTGVSATVVAAAAAELFTIAARAVDVPMRAADPGAAAAKTIPVGGIAMAVLMNAAAGLVVAAALGRWARSPARAFAAVAWTYTALSLLGPVFAAHTQLATKVVLTLAHLIAATLIVPRVTAALRPVGSTRGTSESAAAHQIT